MFKKNRIRSKDELNNQVKFRKIAEAQYLNEVKERKKIQAKLSEAILLRKVEESRVHDLNSRGNSKSNYIAILSTMIALSIAFITCQQTKSIKSQTTYLKNTDRSFIIQNELIRKQISALSSQISSENSLKLDVIVNKIENIRNPLNPPKRSLLNNLYAFTNAVEPAIRETPVGDLDISIERSYLARTILDSDNLSNTNVRDIFQFSNLNNLDLSYVESDSSKIALGEVNYSLIWDSKFVYDTIQNFNLEHSHIYHSVFDNSIFKNGSLKDDTLSYNSFIDASFDDVNFYQSVFYNCDFQNTSFVDCSFQYTYEITASNLKNTTFQDCDLRDTEIKYSDLEYCKFISCDLRNAVLNLSKDSNFRRNNIKAIYPKPNKPRFDLFARIVNNTSVYNITLDSSIIDKKNQIFRYDFIQKQYRLLDTIINNESFVQLIRI